ncbi:MAG: PorP/SprF family type IX secretion system membrane protein, partial [Bacteroidia bacterium]|nr:PorP/SprF family type IX secretion system membrane protein [Bacteroidia bacterium]
MKKITYVSLLLWLVGWGGAWAQDPQFSQFYSNQVMINPAFTGAAQGPRVAMNYRRQWSAIPGYYRTYAFAYDQPVNFGKTRHGLGLSFMADQAGEGNLTKLDVNLCYSYQLDINDNNVVRFGLAGGIQQASIDFFKLRFGDQINPVSGFVNPTAEANIGESRIIESVNAGVVYYNKYLYAGLTANHITQPEQRFYSTVLANADPKLPMRLTAFAGANIPFGEKSYSK